MDNRLLKDLLDEKWQVIKGREKEKLRKIGVRNIDPYQARFWRPETASPLPYLWPPSAGQALCYYGFAYASGPGVRDGVYVAGPWARVLVEPDGSAVREFEMLVEGDLEQIGTQGFRPLEKWELEIYGSRDATWLQLASLNDLPPDDDATAAAIRALYCLWWSHNGVIARAVQAHHTAFFEWLDCKQWMPTDPNPPEPNSADSLWDSLD